MCRLLRGKKYLFFVSASPVPGTALGKMKALRVNIY